MTQTKNVTLFPLLCANVNILAYIMKCIYIHQKLTSRQSIHIPSITKREMGKLKTDSNMYCIMNNWDNMLNLLTHSAIIYGRHFLISMSSDMFAKRWWWDYVMHKQTNKMNKPKRTRLFALIINCIIIMKTKARFSPNVYATSDKIWCNKHLRHTATDKYDNDG